MSYSRGTRFTCGLLRVGYCQCVSSLVDVFATDDSVCTTLNAISQSTSCVGILEVGVNLACEY